MENTELAGFEAAWNAPLTLPAGYRRATEPEPAGFEEAWNAPIVKQPARPGTPSQAARCSTKKVRNRAMERVTICQQCGDYMPLGGFFRAGKWLCASCDVKRERQANFERRAEEGHIDWGYNKEPGVMPSCQKCGSVAVPNNFYGFWCPTCNTYPQF